MGSAFSRCTSIFYELNQRRNEVKLKEMALNNVIEQVIECVSESKQDRLELVLAESERILNRVDERLERIDKRQKDMENIYKQLDGMLYFMEWQLGKNEKKKGE